MRPVLVVAGRARRPLRCRQGKPAPASSAANPGCRHEGEEYSSLLLEGGIGGGGLLVSHGHGDEQLGMVAMMVGGNTRLPSSDHHVISLHSPPATTYTRPHPVPLAGMIRRSGIEREGEMVVEPPLEIGEHMQHMSIVHHPRVPPAMKPRLTYSHLSDLASTRTDGHYYVSKHAILDVACVRAGRANRRWWCASRRRRRRRGERPA